MMKKHTLYFSKYCYFCQKVLFNIKGKEHSIELRSTADAENMQELYQGGGKTQVPCLKIEGGSGVAATWMYESDDIIQYISSNKLLS